MSYLPNDDLTTPSLTTIKLSSNFRVFRCISRYTRYLQLHYSATTLPSDLGEVNVAIPIRDSNRLLVAVESSLYIMDWNIPGAKGLRLLARLDQGLPENVLNDGRADASGRLWIGLCDLCLFFALIANRRRYQNLVSISLFPRTEDIF